jgi:hypothetical protein
VPGHTGGTAKPWNPKPAGATAALIVLVGQAGAQESCAPLSRLTGFTINKPALVLRNPVLLSLAAPRLRYACLHLDEDVRLHNVHDRVHAVLHGLNKPLVPLLRLFRVALDNPLRRGTPAPAWPLGSRPYAQKEEPALASDHQFRYLGPAR